MKRILYTLVVFCAVGFLSCKKSDTDVSIKEYDKDQITSYMTANSLTMTRDAVGGDTTGIYYQVITKGTGPAFKPSDLISYSYTRKTLDGKYASTDTVFNHVNTYAGYVAPNGLQLAINDVALNYGAKIRVIIPSRLMYGVNGTTVSAYNTAGTVIYSTIAGNQSFDYTINIINKTTTNNQDSYDDLCITKYLAASGLTGQYTKATSNSGLWYRVVQAGTAGSPTIGKASTVGVQYTGTLLNGLVFDQANTTDGSAAFYFYGLYGDSIAGMEEALLLPNITNGSKLSIIMPSRLGYGVAAHGGGAITLPAFSCLRFDMNIVTVTN